MFRLSKSAIIKEASVHKNSKNVERPTDAYLMMADAESRNM
jgi:hypothetical protein